MGENDATGSLPPVALSVAGRVLRGTFALTLVGVVNLLGQFAIVPVALHYWGATRYGEWVSLTAFVAFLALSDMGIQTHVVNRMCAHYAKGDRVALISDLHSALRVQLPLLVVFWVCTLVAAFNVPVEHTLGLTSTSHSEAALAVLLLATEVLMAVAMGSIGGVYRATGFMARAAYITALNRLALFAIPTVVLMAGGGFVAVVGARVIVGAVTWAMILVDVRRIHPWFHLFPMTGSHIVGLRMLVPGLLFLFATLADYLSQQGVVTLVQMNLGGSLLAQYSTHRTIANVGRMVSAMLTAAAWPELTAMDARGERTNLVGAHRSLAKLNGWIVGCLLLTLVPCSNVVYSVWTLKVLALDLPTLGILIVQTALWGLWSASSIVLAATNRQGKLVAILLLNSILVLALTYVLVPRLGIRGAAIGSLLGDAAIAGWLIPFVACRVLGDRPLSYVSRVLFPVALSLLIPLLASAALWWMLPWKATRVALVPLVGFGLSTLLLWTVLNPAERMIAQKILANIRRMRLRIPGRTVVETNS